MLGQKRYKTRSKPLNTAAVITMKNNLQNPVFIGDMEGDYEAARDCELEFYQVKYGFGSTIEGCKVVIETCS